LYSLKVGSYTNAKNPQLEHVTQSFEKLFCVGATWTFEFITITSPNEANAIVHCWIPDLENQE